MLAVCILALGATACQDLDINNPNNPQREAVVESAEDVVSLIATGFRRWVSLTQSNTPSSALSNSSDEFSSGFTDQGTHYAGVEPRQAIDNGPTSPNSPNRSPIGTLYSIIAGVNVALQAIEDQGLVIREGGVDQTARTNAFSKFVQGVSHSYVALLYDQAWVYSETVNTDTIVFAPGSTQVQDLLRPYTEVRDTAVAQLERALQISRTNSFSLPSTQGLWIPGLEMDSERFGRVISSYIARTLAYSARSPEERAAVDWERVIEHIDAGIVEDFAPIASPDVLESNFKQRIARQRTTTPGDYMRMDYMLVGHADQSGQASTWANQPWSDRQPFIMEDVRDRRIMSSPDAPCTADSTESHAVEGSYMGCHVATIYALSRGTGQRGYYYYHRLGRLTSWESGPIPIMTVGEMQLLKAEGLLRLGRFDEAIEIINRTRVNNGGLPPVTRDGVPMVDGNCTPRKLNGVNGQPGECGSLWDAYRYEKRMEGAGVDAGIAYWDGRGWGTLVENTPIHFPFPGNQLEILGIPEYTTGGGQQGSAPPPDYDRCPAGMAGLSGCA